MNNSIVLYIACVLMCPTFTIAKKQPDASEISRNAQEATTFEFPAAPRFEVHDIRVEGVSLLPESEIRTLIAPYLGKSATLDGLRGVAAQITAHYHAAGYPLAVAVVPPQRIENGVVRLRVLEGGVGEVRLENASRLSDQTVRAYLPPLPQGAAFRQSDGDGALLRLRQLAGVSDADLRLSPASEQGKTDIAVVLGAAPLFNGSVSADNYGSKSTGRIRSHAALYANSPFGRGERFSFKAMSSFKGVNNVHAGAELPVGARGTVLSLGAGHTRYELGGAFKNLDASGRSNSVELAVRHPLALTRQRALWLTGGINGRKLRDEIGATDTVTRKNVRSVNVGINGDVRNGAGTAYTRLLVNHTFGKLNIVDDDARALDAVAAKTQGAYHKFEAQAAHTRFFGQKWSVSGSLRGQWANKNLDSGEQLGAGGADGVAGYRSNDVSADTGITAKTELRYALNPYVSVSGFVDGARVKQQRKPYLAGKNTLSLYGGGVGAEVRAKGFSLESKLAVRGSRDGASGKRALWWLKAGYAF